MSAGTESDRLNELKAASKFKPTSIMPVLTRLLLLSYISIFT